MFSVSFEVIRSPAAVCCSGRNESHSAHSTVINFGRYQGKTLGGLPDSYLAWMVANIQQSEWRSLAQEVLEERQQNSVTTLVSRLKSVETLAQAKLLHKGIISAGKEGETQLGNLLVEMYVRLGSMGDARLAFSKIQEKDISSWNAVILGYAAKGKYNKVIQLYKGMCFNVDVQPDESTFVGVLEACESLKLAAEGISVHAMVVSSELDGASSLQKAVMRMYISCGLLDAARMVFEGSVSKDIVSWSMLIAGYAYDGCPEEALELYHKLEMEPNDIVLCSALMACSCLGDVKEGKRIQSRIEAFGKVSVVVENALLDMLTRCGCLWEARELFESMKERNVVSWNIMISACLQHDCQQSAAELLRMLDLEGSLFVHFSYVLRNT